LIVGCAKDTWLELIEVQLEGKKRMQAREFLRGYTYLTGVRLG
jgi:methionyl-tRNA formyltransferase